MGMAVKGADQHRLVRRGLVKLLDEDLTDAQREHCGRLIQRADLAIERLKKRKRAREEGRDAAAI